MRVMKFGGTSVGNAEQISQVCKIIEDNLSAKPVVVVSAITGVTNALIELAKERTLAKRVHRFNLIQTTHRTIITQLELDSRLLDNEFNSLQSLTQKRTKFNKETLDQFVSFGERFSAAIVAATLQKRGVDAKAFMAWDLGMITNARFGDAEPLPSSAALIRKKISSLEVLPVITGYIAKTKKGDITTLGRGGSDYTAAVIGAAINAEVIQIWKEVDGFMTSDPRLIPEAKVIPELAFEEASELAYFGAKVLHPKTVVPAMKAEIAVQVLNTFKPENAGTLIVSNFKRRKETSHAIDALTFRKDITVIHIYSPEFFDGNTLLANIFNLFADYNVNIDDVALSVASVSLSMDTVDSVPKQLMHRLKKIGDIVIDTSKSIICAVGGSLHTAGVAGRMFTVLGENDIPVEFISQASSGYSITFLVPKTDVKKALKVLHKECIQA